MKPPALLVGLALACHAASAAAAAAPAARPEFIRVAPAGRGFVFADSGKPFVPWGFNYSTSKRLIEDFWHDEWQTVADDLAEMKALGASVVRVHLQFAKFMDAPDRPNARSLDRLARLLDLAEKTGLYLDLTGLACYRKEDTPIWYDALDERARWAAQAAFWRAVARRCQASPAVFCYCLINEPLVPGEARKPGDWLTGKLGPFYFLQFVTLDPAGRKREDVATEWVKTMAEAIREEDRRHLVTIGLLPTLPNGANLCGFLPARVGPHLDFISVHVYPEKGKVNASVAMLDKYLVPGKPLVIEETFPLACSAEELRGFLLESRAKAHGWLGHYEGQTIEDLEALQRDRKIDLPQAFMLAWLRLFRDVGPEMRQGPSATRPAP